MGFKQSYLNNPNIDENYKKKIYNNLKDTFKKESTIIKNIIHKEYSGTKYEY